MSELPRGTVTLFFADVEGSTRLAADHGGDWGNVLAEVRRLLREAVAAAGGHEVDSRGDEHFAAFEDAQAAAEAALAAQRAHAEYDWPGAPVRVRIGLHTGAAARHRGRLRRDRRPPRQPHLGRGARRSDPGLRPHVQRTRGSRPDRPGLYALPDLADPEQIFQLGEGEFPPLRARPGTAALKVVLADDSVLLREGLARLLEETGFEVAAQSDNAVDLLRHVAMHRPDVAITDIRMPPTQTDEGLRAAQQIREQHPEVGVVVLSQYVEPAYALELLGESAEGVGYLLKDRVSDFDEFAAAVRRVAEGGSALDPAVVDQLVGRRRRDDPLEELTAREREVLEAMAEGRSNQAIAERMFVTLRAVEKHVTSIFTKLRLPASGDDHRRVLAVLTYLRQ